MTNPFEQPPTRNIERERKITCPKCNGNGKDSDNNNCSRCSGKGYILEPK